MRAVFALVLLLTTPALAQSANPLTVTDARHLLSRTGFDPAPAMLLTVAGTPHVHAVDTLLSALRTNAITRPPPWIDEPLPDLRKLRSASAAERKAFRKKMRQQGVALQGWWLREMVVTDSPLTERMTLFWHNHFTSALAKVRAPALMYRQNALFRRLGTANFEALLRAVLRDPAMLVYLDNHRNNKRKPNENLARELLELFTLGEGHYTEADIRATARALTGHGVDRTSGTYRFRRKQHDAGNKSFMGTTGALGVDEIVTELLRQPRTAVYLSTRLWREFADDAPPPAVIQTLAQALRRHGYAIKPWLRAMFMTPEFMSSSTLGARIKSPVEFVVGLVRVFDVPVNEPRQLARATRRLGQELMNPPNVKGWPGGNHWLSADTMIVRQHVLGRFLRGVPMASGMGGPTRKMQRTKMRQREVIAGWVADLPAVLRNSKGLANVLLALPPVGDIDGAGQTSVERVESLLMDPVYQLK